MEVSLRQSGDAADAQGPWFFITESTSLLQDSALIFLESRLAHSSLPAKLRAL